MSHLNFLAVLVCVSVGVVFSQDPCTPAAQNLMTTCSEGGSISMPNYLWFVTNGTSQNGQAPPDEAAFKTQICNAQPQVGGCIFSQLGELANTTCSGSPQVLQAVQNFLITYDIKCAHPCRFTLVDDLRKCYVSSGLSSNLFLSNRTAGQVIGANKAEVDDFCMKKDALMGCMKPVHDACPEAIPIMAAQNFNLPSYSKGVDILCSKPAAYLTGLECFAEPTTQVQACVQKTQQAFMQANIDAQANQATPLEFAKATCTVTMHQVDCDLNAWAEKKHESCTPAVVGLRREMECSLLPPNCTVWDKPTFDDVCHVSKFMHGGSAGGQGGGSLASSVVSLPASVLAFLAFVLPLVKRIGA